MVCSCAFKNGRFGFEVVDSWNDLKRCKGSKYVKSDPIGAYRAIRSLLREGRRVLFIGLPCQVSSMRNFCDDSDSLYTVDLICHGTPSPKILGKFLAEHGFDIKKASNIGFRRKASFAVRDGETCMEAPGVTDRYTIAFLKKLVESSGLKLLPANQQRAQASNGQLCHPSVKPKQRGRFFLDLSHGNSVSTAVSRAFPLQSLKQDIKKALVKVRLWKPI